MWARSDVGALGTEESKSQEFSFLGRARQWARTVSKASFSFLGNIHPLRGRTQCWLEGASSLEPPPLPAFCPHCQASLSQAWVLTTFLGKLGGTVESCPSPLLPRPQKQSPEPRTPPTLIEPLCNVAKSP